MEIEEILNRLLDFFLFEKEWPQEFSGLHLTQIYDAVKEFAELFDIDLSQR